MQENKKNIYFASDVHLGLPDFKKSLEREKLFVSWLDEIKNDAAAIYLLGDIFDFWFEYRNVVPRGFTRVLGKIAELTDIGIPVHFFRGNHDMWAFDYLPQETGCILHDGILKIEFNGKKFYIAHGDGLGPGDYKYKFLRLIFKSSISHWLFARIHPNFGVGFANSWSHKSRKLQGAPSFHGEDKEWLILHAKNILKKEHFDYFIFGHRHIVLEFPLSEKSTYFNLGDWINNFTYGVFDGEKMMLKKFRGK
ncbi:MAG: UDP-2,3-diacylglucosamine hydrolase [Bacteroidetes bacterium RIFOXYA12_FULL_35_11]|nr:MAG: UDP-2,3-diacylglucosamine hydrolase [Bacteroidetes bacterium GWF2_35_48]OFY76361.1 MAG: UDP-2,3-diacylglucosamine hydrolase [Bacteroidetes bacterium RIFOXYA12_FULL_35_11]HBX52457.1 UDP-2,3-diacylglucosamine hydrolase [Bacteroidales bacterium]